MMLRSKVATNLSYGARTSREVSDERTFGEQGDERLDRPDLRISIPYHAGDHAIANSNFAPNRSTRAVDSRLRQDGA